MHRSVLSLSGSLCLSTTLSAASLFVPSLRISLMFRISLSLMSLSLSLFLSISLSLSFSPARLEDCSQERWAAMETFIAVHHHVGASAQCLADRRRHRHELRGPGRGVVDRHVERFDCNQNNNNNNDN